MSAPTTKQAAAQVFAVVRVVLTALVLLLGLVVLGVAELISLPLRAAR